MIHTRIYIQEIRNPNRNKTNPKKKKKKKEGKNWNKPDEIGFWNQ